MADDDMVVGWSGVPAAERKTPFLDPSQGFLTPVRLDSARNKLNLSCAWPGKP
jgi:hypothetical protein